MKRRTKYKVSEMGPRSVDVYVGDRLRTRRTLLGMSQESLAKSVNLTFQQIQKYEKGTNRIGASRLYEFSSILDVAPEWFFIGYDSNGGEREEPFLQKRETLELVRNFDSCSEKNQNAVLNFIKTVANGSKNG